MPAIVVGYGLTNSDVGRYGVAPTYQEGTQLRTAKILSQKTGKFDTRDFELIKSGVPSVLGSGTRTLYTATQREPSIENLGISRFDLLGDLDVYSDEDDLSNSYPHGWVGLVFAEGGAPHQRKQ